MKFSNPISWGGIRPARQRNDRRKTLYQCKKVWLLKTKAGPSFPMPCRKCPGCIGNRKNNLVGRMLAQATECFDVWFLTLTYDDAKLLDHEDDGAKRRIPGHIKAMMHNLRQQCRRATGESPDLKYFAVYEEGSQTQRGHWHMILFFGGNVPADVIAEGCISSTAAMQEKPEWHPATEVHRVPLKEYLARRDNLDVVCLRGGSKHQQSWRPWRHGIVTVESLYRGPASRPKEAHRAMAYCTKYAMKGNGRYLTSNGLGGRFFREWVFKHIRHGLMVHDMTYTFLDQEKAPAWKDQKKEREAVENGRQFRAKERKRVYQLTGVMRDRVLSEAVRFKRERVKNYWRRRLAQRGESVRENRTAIQRDLALETMGTEFMVWQADRMRYRASFDSELLERLRRQNADQPRELADELCDIGARAADFGGNGGNLPPLTF